MLDVRANIVANASKALAKATTIALRYSLARKQVHVLSRRLLLRVTHLYHMEKHGD